jgi:hypothetical protein
MRVVDTSAFIEWVSKLPAGINVIPRLRAIADWIVPKIRV